LQFTEIEDSYFEFLSGNLQFSIFIGLVTGGLFIWGKGHVSLIIHDSCDLVLVTAPFKKEALLPVFTD
jgi:hypothetical protein